MPEGIAEEETKEVHGKTAQTRHSHRITLAGVREVENEALKGVKVRTVLGADSNPQCGDGPKHTSARKVSGRADAFKPNHAGTPYLDKP
jgi:hypothetical protein